MVDICKILYVDDESFNLILLGTMFRSEFDIVTASSGTKALDIIKQSPEINAVITDMRMPVMNGLEFIEKAKEINDSIPYFILSGYELDIDIKNALETNVIQGFFQKPVNKKKITSVLRTFL